jgi:hypothetical protein
MSIPWVVVFMFVFICAVFLVCERRKLVVFQAARRATFLECATFRKLAEWRVNNPDMPIYASKDGRQLVLDCIAAWIVFLAAHPEYKDNGQCLMYLRSLLFPEDPYDPPPVRRGSLPYVPKRLADASRSFLFATLRFLGYHLSILCFQEMTFVCVF